MYKKKQKTQLIKIKFDAALKDFEKGTFKSILQCAAHHKVAYSTLHRLLTNIQSNGFVGSGRKQICLSEKEEDKILQHVKWRASVGYGVNWHQLTLLIQEVLIAVKSVNPTRKTGYEDSNQLPNIDFVRRFAL